MVRILKLLLGNPLFEGLYVVLPFHLIVLVKIKKLGDTSVKNLVVDMTGSAFLRYSFKPRRKLF